MGVLEITRNQYRNSLKSMGVLEIPEILMTPLIASD